MHICHVDNGVVVEILNVKIFLCCSGYFHSFSSPNDAMQINALPIESLLRKEQQQLATRINTIP